jgi:hypothetical protein
VFTHMNQPLTRPDRSSSSEDGFVMVVTILLVLVVATLVTAAVIVGSNHLLASKYYERQSTLETYADAGLEMGRALINGDPSLYPATGYLTLENEVAVTDGAGNVIPGVKRSLYVGPTGVTSGQYGVFGSVVSVVKDDGGGAVVRRAQVNQESFAKFAYFTDIEPSYISFGGGDVIFGPVHTNSDLKIYSSGATFYKSVRTAKRVPTPQYGTFMQGYEEYVPRIEMPKTADLGKVSAQAAAGGTLFAGDSKGGLGDATTRVEFVAIDLNADGDVTDSDEGFFKVYQSTDWDWVVSDFDSNLTNNANCGAWYGNLFVPASAHPYDHDNNPGTPDKTGLDAVRSATRRCYLGGSDELTNGFVPNDGKGAWLPFTGTPVPGLAGRADNGYLFPLARRYNPSFKGVIAVTGRVAVSGVLRGKVTLSATDDIVLADDIVYATDPGAGLCQDMLGLFSGDKIVVSYNLLNAPQRPKSGYDYITYDDTKDEFFQGVLLALDVFMVEGYNAGSRNDEKCESKVWGRGCLYLTGGIIQKTRGAVGTGAGTGYVKRYSYDGCAATEPPPYFPTTGRFVEGPYYQIDPTNFSVAALYDRLTPN